MPLGQHQPFPHRVHPKLTPHMGSPHSTAYEIIIMLFTPQPRSEESCVCLLPPASCSLANTYSLTIGSCTYSGLLALHGKGVELGRCYVGNFPRVESCRIQQIHSPVGCLLQKNECASRKFSCLGNKQPLSNFTLQKLLLAQPELSRMCALA